VGGRLAIETQQLAAGRGGAKRSDGAGGMPAAVERMARLRRAAELCHHLEADHIGVQNIAS
jgi:hypothetical protein